MSQVSMPGEDTSAGHAPGGAVRRSPTPRPGPRVPASSSSASWRPVNGSVVRDWPRAARSPGRRRSACPSARRSRPVPRPPCRPPRAPHAAARARIRLRPLAAGGVRARARRAAGRLRGARGARSAWRPGAGAEAAGAGRRRPAPARAPRAPAWARPAGAGSRTGGAGRGLDHALGGLVDAADDLVHARHLAESDDGHGEKSSGAGGHPGEGGARAQVVHRSP